MTNPVYTTKKMRIIELGASACATVFVIDAKSLKNMLIETIMVNATSMKKKKGPGSRRRLAITASVARSQRKPLMHLVFSGTYSKASS
jgi:hypothetical protein